VGAEAEAELVGGVPWKGLGSWSPCWSTIHPQLLGADGNVTDLEDLRAPHLEVRDEQRRGQEQTGGQRLRETYPNSPS
jgi:hypothetical protein